MSWRRQIRRLGADLGRSRLCLGPHRRCAPLDLCCASKYVTAVLMLAYGCSPISQGPVSAAGSKHVVPVGAGSNLSVCLGIMSSVLRLQDWERASDSGWLFGSSSRSPSYNR